MAQWMEFAAQAPLIAAAGRRLLSGKDGIAIGFLATTGRSALPHLAPVCPIFADDDIYLCVRATSAKAVDLRDTGGYALHAFLGPNDEEFMIGGRATEIFDPNQIAAVHAAIPFPSFDPTDPIFRLSVSRALWTVWHDPGTPNMRAVRNRWPSNRKDDLAHGRAPSSESLSLRLHKGA